MKYAICTPWHDEKQKESFLEAWKVEEIPDFLILQQDKDKSGCAKTKNRAMYEAKDRGAEVIIVLDDDCYPVKYFDSERDEQAKDALKWATFGDMTLEQFANLHMDALEPQEVELFEAVTDPPSRGTPYHNRTVRMPVAASMGFWDDVPDWDAPSQLVRGDKPMQARRKTMFWRFFPLSGMNLAFRSEWARDFIDVPRFDDIWMGFSLQREAYDKGHCFNLNGPTVRHSRQSNVWANLKIEAENLENNEHYWKQFAKFP